MWSQKLCQVDELNRKKIIIKKAMKSRPFTKFLLKKTNENVQNSSISPVSPVSPFLYSYFDMVSRYVVHNRVV